MNITNIWIQCIRRSSIHINKTVSTVIYINSNGKSLKSSTQGENIVGTSSKYSISLIQKRVKQISRLLFGIKFSKYPAAFVNGEYSHNSPLAFMLSCVDTNEYTHTHIRNLCLFPRKPFSLMINNFARNLPGILYARGPHTFQARPNFS